eukprot:443550-Rhodomonas_salina.1
MGPSDCSARSASSQRCLHHRHPPSHHHRRRHRRHHIIIRCRSWRVGASELKAETEGGREDPAGRLDAAVLH